MKALFSRLTADMERGLPVFFAGFIKRMLEGKYDALINKTKFGRSLKSSGPQAKFGIEGLLNIFSAIVDSELPEDSFLKRVAKEVAIDAGPEIAKRIINGDVDVAEKIGGLFKARIEKEVEPGSTNTPQEIDLAKLLLQLDNETLADLLAWTYGIDQEERWQTIGVIRGLSPENLAKFAGLSAEEKERLVKLLGVKPPAKKSESKVAPEIEEVIDRMRLGVAELREGLKKREKEASHDRGD